MVGEWSFEDVTFKESVGIYQPKMDSMDAAGDVPLSNWLIRVEKFHCSAAANMGAKVEVRD